LPHRTSSHAEPANPFGAVARLSQPSPIGGQLRGEHTRRATSPPKSSNNASPISDPLSRRLSIPRRRQRVPIRLGHQVSSQHAAEAVESRRIEIERL
jgi:hypothetical protein